MKRAMIVASFGSTSPAAVEAGVRPIEEAVAAAHPGVAVHRAFTSALILERLRMQGVQAESVEECVSRLKREGCAEIIVVPALMVPGHEYRKICSQAAGCRIVPPLLCSEADIEWMAAFLGSIASGEPGPLLLMGHGSDSEADSIYTALRKKLPGKIFLACLEGNCTLELLLPDLDRLPEKTLILMPLMLTAGRHVLRDMIGDDEHSWKSVLESRGFKIRTRMQGLSAFPEICRRFAEKSLQ